MTESVLAWAVVLVPGIAALYLLRRAHRYDDRAVAEARFRRDLQTAMVTIGSALLPAMVRASAAMVDAATAIEKLSEVFATTSVSFDEFLEDWRARYREEQNALWRADHPKLDDWISG